MTDQAWIAEAKRMRDQGLTYLEIALELDREVSTVWARLNVERRREQQRRADAKRRPRKGTKP